MQGGNNKNLKDSSVEGIMCIQCTPSGIVTFQNSTNECKVMCFTEVKFKLTAGDVG